MGCEDHPPFPPISSRNMGDPTWIYLLTARTTAPASGRYFSVLGPNGGLSGSWNAPRHATRPFGSWYTQESPTQGCQTMDPGDKKSKYERSILKGTVFITVIFTKFRLFVCAELFSCDRLRLVYFFSSLSSHKRSRVRLRTVFFAPKLIK